MLLLALRMIIAHIGASATPRRVRSRSKVVEVAFHEIVMICVSPMFTSAAGRTLATLIVVAIVPRPL